MSKHVEQLDESRHEEVKRYQMMKEHERRENLKSLSQEQRQEEERRYQEARLKHAEHPRINHPVRPAESAQPSAESAGLTGLCFRSGKPGPAEGGVAGDRRPGPGRLRPQDLLQAAR